MDWFEDAENRLARMQKAREEAAEEWKKFTPRARRILAFAENEAKTAKLAFIGVEHLLLGLLAPGDGVAVDILRRHGVTLDAVRTGIAKDYGASSEEKLPNYITLTPRLKRVLTNAKKEAEALNHPRVGTMHLLLGLVAETDGVPYRIINMAKADPSTIRREVLEEIARRENPPDNQ